MAVEITYDALEAPGKGRKSPAMVKGGLLCFLTGTISFDSAHPAGGEDISEIFDHFNDVTGTSTLKGMWVESPTGSAGTGLNVVIDHANKKAILYTNAADPAAVVNDSDQSGAADLHFLAWGLR